MPVAGGTLTGGLTGTTSVFTTSISSRSISGTHYGNGYNLTNLNAGNITTTVTTNTNTITLALSDASTFKRLDTSGGSFDVIIPLNSSAAFNIGTQIVLGNFGVNIATISATAGVTLVSKDNKNKLSSLG